MAARPGSNWPGSFMTRNRSRLIRNNPSNIYVVDSVGVQRSTNGGVSFTTITPPFPGGVYVQAFALDSSTGDLYFCHIQSNRSQRGSRSNLEDSAATAESSRVDRLGNQVFAGVDSPSSSVRSEVESRRKPDAVLHLLRRQLFGSRSRRSLSTRKTRRSSPATRLRPIFQLPRPSPRLRRRNSAAALWRS